jgi:hypothetical protein
MIFKQALKGAPGLCSLAFAAGSLLFYLFQGGDLRLKSCCNLLELFGLFALDLLKMFQGGLLLGFGFAILRVSELLLGSLDLDLHFSRRSFEVLQGCLTEKLGAFRHRYDSEVGQGALQIIDRRAVRCGWIGG